MIKCEDLEKCFSESSDKKKTLKDKKGGNSRLMIENKLKKIFHIIDFENCVYKDLENYTKCDFGLKIENELYYIELKGSDVKQGIAQLKSTIIDTKHCFKNANFRGIIIVSKFSKPNIVKQRTEYKDLMKLVNQKLIITENIHTENI